MPGDKTPPYDKALIKSVARGGDFETAGFRSGDILPDIAGLDLYRLLVTHRRESVELAAINICEIFDGDRAFEEIPRRLLMIVVPQRGR